MPVGASGYLSLQKEMVCSEPLKKRVLLSLCSEALLLPLGVPPMWCPHASLKVFCSNVMFGVCSTPLIWGIGPT